MEGETILFLGNQVPADTFGWITLAIALWDLIWKAIGIYMAAGRGDRRWAVAMLIFNTVGILPIVYIFFFAAKVESVEVESITEIEDETSEQ
jgi:hypothetical protein